MSKGDKPTRDMDKENEMLLALFENATEGIIICKIDGTIAMVNPTAKKMFGYEEEELVGQKVEMLIPTAMRKNHSHYREEFSRSPHSRAMGKEMDLFAQNKSHKTFPVEVSLSPFNTKDGTFIVCFIIDISERKESEQALREKNEEISRLNEHLESKVKERTRELAIAIRELAESKNDVLKALEKEKHLNELKSRFVTTASHEFRTPLGTILSSASLISKYQSREEQEKRDKHINRIKSSVSNLTEILNDFLSLDKLEEGVVRNSPQEFMVQAFIKSVVDEVSAICKTGQHIVVSHEGNQEAAILDTQLFKNVLINLISNAIKYSDPGSKIAVKSKLYNSELLIEVADNGFGIPPEDQPHVFERFYRANNSGNIQGTGLGLNIVKKYVELMKGTISFNSELGKGTTFVVKISF